VYEPGAPTTAGCGVILSAMQARRATPAVAVVAITVLLAGALVAVVLSPPRRVILYGDSLASEARDWFTLAIADGGAGEVVDRTFGGSAICDWLDKMRGDARAFHPAAVVFEFVGNNATNCVHAPTGVPLTGAALAQRYRDDARRATAIFAGLGVRVYWMGAPAVAPSSPSAAVDIVAVQRAEAEEAAGWTFGEPPFDRVRFVDAGRAVLDHGRYAPTLPCLASETAADGCVGGRITVRADDGVHFCPTGVVRPDGRCPVYSSGAARFGFAMAAPVRRDLGL
jgi:hypothetical protein